MAVAYDDRDVPLVPDAATLASLQVLAYDFTGHDTTLAEGAAHVFAGATNPTLTKTGTISLVTLAGIPGRKATLGAYYERSSSTNFGLQVGTGDFCVGLMVCTGATLPTTNNSVQVMEVQGASGPILAVFLEEFASNGWYMNASGTAGLGGSVTPIFYGINKRFITWLRRVGGVISGWTQEWTDTSELVRRYNDASGNTTNWNSTNAERLRFLLSSSATIDICLVGARLFSGTVTDTQMRDAGRDWFALEENGAVPDSIAITSPTTGATIPTTTTVSGTYTFATGAPAGIEVQHGSGSWVSLTSFTASAGTWSGSVSLSTATAAPLRARVTATPALVSPDVTGIVVANNGIAFRSKDYTTYTNRQALAHRIFQRNGSDNATGVRVVGTYTGSPTSIEWRFNGGSWATLVATPSGGAFDATVTLNGPAQGALEVRFSNDTAVNASLANVGVGDLYILIGQSNAVGAATHYVSPIAPASHPGWVPTKFGKDHTWQPIAETSTDKFDDETAVYAAFSGPASPGGSFCGALATLIQAEGVPVAFIPCAKGSTESANWLPGSPVTNTSTLLGAAMSTALLVGDVTKVLTWQGEAEGSGVGDETLLASNWDTIIDQWVTTVGASCTFIIVVPTYTGMGSDADALEVRSQLINLQSLNAAVVATVDMDVPTPAYTGIHYDTPAQINATAARIFEVMGYAISRTITTEALHNEANALLTSTTIPKAYAIRLSDDTLVRVWANEETDAAGVLAVSGVTLEAEPHVLVTVKASAPQAAGAKIYTPA